MTKTPKTNGSSRPKAKPATKKNVIPDARSVAVDALVRIDTDGAFANLLLPKVLARSTLAERDRAFATQLVYGTTRHRRACDWFINRYAHGDLEPKVRAALRMGTFQLKMLGTPPHAAVSATVDTVPRRARGLVNAVLRKIDQAEDAWPSDAVRLSYPDWVVATLTADLGRDRALGALESMNGAASVVERSDGYVQDPASQWVAEAVDAQPSDRILDLCSAPGGKATALSSSGAEVVAADHRFGRARLVLENRERLGIDAAALPVVVADGARVPFAPASFDKVLVDAPCSGLGSLRRRPDARWRIDEAAPERLAALQSSLLDEAARTVAPGGVLVYSVCTLTVTETTAVADRFASDHPAWETLGAPGGPWEPWGSGVVLLPQTEGTDGMALFRWRAPAAADAPAPEPTSNRETT